jgi:hypothetical protein
MEDREDGKRHRGALPSIGTYWGRRSPRPVALCRKGWCALVHGGHSPIEQLAKWLRHKWLFGQCLGTTRAATVKAKVLLRLSL